MCTGPKLRESFEFAIAERKIGVVSVPLIGSSLPVEHRAVLPKRLAAKTSARLEIRVFQSHPSKRPGQISCTSKTSYTSSSRVSQSASLDYLYQHHTWN